MMFGVVIVRRPNGSPADYAVYDRRRRVLAYGFTLYGRRYVAFPWQP